MSVPQFKEIVSYKIGERVNEFRSYLENQEGADYATLRSYQGKISGLKMALDIIKDEFRSQFG